ncbi:MAG TPA: hypothetical protein VMH86_03830 [Rhizomicrobium sp.]|nr:hypothetical protein [Rhizomicrobium sp.]
MQNRLPVFLVAALALSGCASIRGMQEPITASDVDASKLVCPSVAEVDKFNGAWTQTIDRRNFRDQVIAACIKAIDRNYAQFKVKLQEDAVGANLATDLASLGLSGAAAITKGQTAKQFAQGSTVVIGIGTAINKDVFYEQALPAVESAMDANRATLLAGILNSEKNDPDATSYTLTSAALDLDAYQSAGNIYTAIAVLTKTASDASQQASQDVANAQMASYAVTAPLDSATQAGLVALNKSIKALKDPADRAKLDSIAGAVGAQHAAGMAFRAELGAVIYKTTQRVRTAANPAAELATLQGLVTPLL